MDTITDDAIATIHGCLRLQPLNWYREKVMFDAASDGTKTPTTFHSLLIDVASTEDMKIQFSLWRDHRAPIDTPWDIRFTVFVRGFGYERQLERFKKALLQLKRTKTYTI